MARTIAEKERVAAQIAERLATQDGDVPWCDAKPLHRIADAFRHSVAAEAELAEAVRAARAEGFPCAAIGVMPGVSKQAAQARYGG